MTKPGEGMIYDEPIHISCPDKHCRGMIIFNEIKDRTEWFKCSLCDKYYVRINARFKCKSPKS